ncbi:MAG: hypothetical protein K0V04_19345 [Deltaproteobacteria bacterium]|nr:hypothetical protein [Deltaproteobacteria bacterium]
MTIEHPSETTSHPTNPLADTIVPGAREDREVRAFRPAALARRGRVEPVSEALPPPPRRTIAVGWAVATTLVAVAMALLSHDVAWADLRRVVVPH